METSDARARFPADQNPADEIPYRQAVEMLMYLMIGTRSIVVGKLSQFFEKPLKSHWNAVERVLRYIFAGDPESRPWWPPHREADYIASCLTTKGALWLSLLYSEFYGLAIPNAATICIYNTGLISSAQNTSINQRNKHVDI
eukprot:IDg11319t1